MTNRKEAFNQWIESVFADLRDQHQLSELEMNTEALSRGDWWQLWRIFEKQVENANSSKDLSIAFDEANPKAGEVILVAHGVTSNDLEFEAMMRDYNSDKYD